jgi:hypothetical protein
MKSRLDRQLREVNFSAQAVLWRKHAVVLERKNVAEVHLKVVDDEKPKYKSLRTGR